MEKCVIVSGGEYSSLSFIDSSYFVIACDKGYEYTQMANVVPNIVLGDFDSCKKPIPSDINTLVLPVEKDDTDTTYAIKYAIKNGAKEIVLTCALGGRLDHLVANIQSCVYAVKCGVEISLKSDDCEIFFMTNSERCFEKRAGYSFSVFSVTEKCSGVCLSGAKYPLKNAVLENSFPIGVSNEWLDSSIKVTVSNGILMIIMSKLV